jgi:ABC-type dipeptide/oligopeptide/nickel transport system permease subunit
MIKRIVISLIISSVMGWVAGYVGYGLIDVINVKMSLDLPNELPLILDICVVVIPISVMGFILVNEAFKGIMK